MIYNYAYSGIYTIKSVDISVAGVHWIQHVLLTVKCTRTTSIKRIFQQSQTRFRYFVVPAVNY